MRTRIDKKIDELIQSAFSTAMRDLKVTDEELPMLRIIEEEFERIRERIHELYDDANLSNEELTKGIRLTSKSMIMRLTQLAVSDQKISADEMAILQSLTNKLGKI